MAYLDFSNKRYSKDQLADLRAMLVKLNSSTLMPEEAGSITLNEFREWLEGAVDAYVDENQASLKGPKGDTGSVGATGVGIQNISNYYATTNTYATPPLSEITSPTIPTMSSYNKYLWKKEVTTFTDNSTSSAISLAGVYGDTGSQGAQGPQGPQGATGAAGADGIDGSSAYVHIKYAGSVDESTGIPNDEDMTDAPSIYMGIYSDSSVLASDSAADYIWTRIKGEDGADGRGINIKAGAEACTEVGDSYIRNSDGHLMILVSIDPENVFEDAGQFKGDKGDTGAPGAKGDKGDKGDTGNNGADATQYYYHIVYTNDTSTGEGYSTTPSNQLYLGTYTDTTLADAVNWSEAQTKDIKWHYAKGATGETGAQGPQGIQGLKGETGAQGLSEITLMTTTKGTQAAIESWAEGAGSTPFSSIISDYSKVKVGDLVWFVATCNDTTSPYYNKKGSIPKIISAINSTSFSTIASGLSTEWEALDGAKGDKGDQGNPGQNGADGVNGDYTEYQFARNDDPNNAPATGWQDGPPTTGGQYLWCRERRISY